MQVVRGHPGARQPGPQDLLEAGWPRRHQHRDARPPASLLSQLGARQPVEQLVGADVRARLLVAVVDHADDARGRVGAAPRDAHLGRHLVPCEALGGLLVEDDARATATAPTRSRATVRTRAGTAGTAARRRSSRQLQLDRPGPLAPVGSGGSHPCSRPARRRRIGGTAGSPGCVERGAAWVDRRDARLADDRRAC